jgi:hypothetical protein
MRAPAHQRPPSPSSWRTVSCECCLLRMIESTDDASEKDGTLVHAGDCEQEWGSAYSAAYDNEADEEALDEGA